MARSPAATRPSLVDHPLLTTAGLFAEAHAGLAQVVEPQIEAAGGLTTQWFELLIRLLRSPDQRLRMSDLAAQSTLSASGLTRAVDRLEAAGLVARQACPTDRRSTYAVLTPEGRDRIAAALPVHVDQLEGLFGDAFTAAELATFTGLLRKLRDAVNPCAAAASEPGGLPG